MNIYIASSVKDGGIYHYKKEADGQLKFVEKKQMDSPKYMIIKDKKMYIVLTASFENGDSGMVVYDIDEDGRLENPSDILSTQGTEVCHITVYEENIYCANYASGSVILMPDILVQHHGSGPREDRQEGPHTHFVGMTPDNKYLCVTDLGLDTIFLYHPDMTLHSTVKVPAGHGVRHLAFSEDGKYLFAANELESTVAAFAYQDGELTFLDVCSTLPAGWQGESYVAAIRIKDGFIYVSNRGHDSIAELTFSEEKVHLQALYDCGGSFPRDFVFAGEELICTNQLGNNVTFLDVTDEFKKKMVLEIPAPLCVCVD